MLGSYATHDHRVNSIKQRRLVSEFLLLPSGTAVAGLMDTYPIARSDSAIAEGIMPSFLF